MFTVFVNFKDPIPQEPSEFAATQLAKKYKNEAYEDEVTKVGVISFSSGCQLDINAEGIHISHFAQPSC